jgi:hypothetical protein
MTLSSELNAADGKALLIVGDVLLPGDGDRWPAASRAIDLIGRVPAEFGERDASWLLRIAAEVAARPEAERPDALRSVERAEPLAFERLVSAFFRVYYTSGPVLAAVETLADAGPRETSPHFDPALVMQVLATRAGQRRL